MNDIVQNLEQSHRNALTDVEARRQAIAKATAMVEDMRVKLQIAIGVANGLALAVEAAKGSIATPAAPEPPQPPQVPLPPQAPAND